jgi:hypothetical protein
MSFNIIGVLHLFGGDYDQRILSSDVAKVKMTRFFVKVFVHQFDNSDAFRPLVLRARSHWVCMLSDIIG